ncbi:potassium-transporting ATPase subunit A [Serratia rubidaea]|uniref:Potassium-transporting ATPase subunit A n=1 Tax=Serratia rubidaea TaxID=61652 RepID=A0A4U9HBD0_SERRU|nr:potassium-transporting ATPase subunit A [Serratia rubidaea]
MLRHSERFIRSCSGSRGEEMNWRQYALAILLFNLLGIILLMALLMGQGALPLNPQGFPGMSWHLALNTAVSFVTNTNWQAYSGESTLSYLSQMAGLTVQNFLSAASGIAVAFALIRAFSRRSSATIGNAWLDIWRITLYVLLPLSLLIALFFVSQGVLQNLSPYLHLTTLEGGQQVLPMGPVASQEAIKMLGTNGGGFFGANSSHPFENPTALSNMVQMLAIFLIPSALCFAFGQAAGENRQGHTLLWAMSLIFVVAVVVVMYAEQAGNPHLSAAGADSMINMEGKESRFGILASSLFSVVTTAASCGAVNAMHDSFTALGGMVPMWLMQIGEVVFGGVGSGLYGMLLFVLLTVFIAGLMIGRTPEYLGKKIDVDEMKMTALANPGDADAGAAGQRAGAGNRRRTQRYPQPRRPRAERSAVRLLLRRQQQRQRLRRAERQHAVLQPAAGLRHAGWPLRRDPAGAGDRRFTLAPKIVSRRGTAPCRPTAAVCRPADRHRTAGWRPDLYSCSGAGPGGRAFTDLAGPLTAS